MKSARDKATGSIEKTREGEREKQMGQSTSTTLNLANTHGEDIKEKHLHPIVYFRFCNSLLVSLFKKIVKKENL